MKALIIFSFVPALAADLDQAEVQPSFWDQPTLTTSGDARQISWRFVLSEVNSIVTKGEGDRNCKYWGKWDAQARLAACGGVFRPR